MKPNVIRVIALSSLLALFGGTLFSQTPKSPPPKKMVQHKGTSDSSTGPDLPVNDQPEMITSSYIRMNHPEFLLRLAAQVKSGEASKADLDRFAGPTYSQIILSHDLSSLGGNRKKHMPPATGLQFAHLIVGSPYGLLPTPLPQTEYAPKSISYSKLIPKVMQTPSVNFTSPTNCNVTVSFTTNRDVFTAAMMESFKGTVSGNDNNGLVGDIDQTAPSGGTLPVKAGQDCVLMLNVGAAKEGKYSTICTISGTGANGTWEAKIPISVDCSYSNAYSVKVDQLDNLVYLIPGHNFAFHLKITPVNYSGPFEYKFNWVPTDPGVTLNQQTIHVTSAKAFNVTFTGKCAKNVGVPGGDVFYSATLLPSNNLIQVSVLYTVIPGALRFHCGTIVSAYHQALVVLIGDETSFTCTWTKPAVYVDSDGNFAVLDDIYDGVSYWPPSEWATPADGVPFGIYFSKDGMNHGSYGQVTGKSVWLKNNWEDIVNGFEKAHIWFMPAKLAEDAVGALPPLVDGMFVLDQTPPKIIKKW